MLKASRRYEPRASFRSYLFGIAFNLLSASRRKTQRRGDVSSPDLDGLAGASSDPAAVLWVRQALAALDPKDREIVMLREYDALDYTEIAARRRRACQHRTLAAVSSAPGASREARRRATRHRSQTMTITHEIDREEVMAYLDGEIAAARAVVVRAHLDQCAECRALADELREVSAGLGEWTVEPAPDTLVAPAAIGPSGDRANGLLKSFSDRPMSSRFRWSLVGATVLGLALVAVTWNMLERRSSGDVVVGTGQRRDSARCLAYRPATTAGADGSRRSRQLRALGYASGPTVSVNAKAPVTDTKKTTTGATSQQGQGGSVTDFATAGTIQAAANTQMIVRTASIALSTEKFDDMRAALERVAADRHGSVGSLTLAGDPPNQRSMSATLRVPIAEMDAALAGVRALGRVLQESQSSEDVTDAHRDLAIRISNSKIEEARLGEILKQRTGRLSDVLAVEQAQSRVRTEIEQMEAQELAMRNRAALSTISVQVDERYRAELADAGPLPSASACATRSSTARARRSRARSASRSASSARRRHSCSGPRCCFSRRDSCGVVSAGAQSPPPDRRPGVADWRTGRRKSAELVEVGRA